MTPVKNLYFDVDGAIIAIMFCLVALHFGNVGNSWDPSRNQHPGWGGRCEKIWNLPSNIMTI